MTVTDSLFGDALPDVLWRTLSERRLEIIAAIEIAEASLFLGQAHGSPIGRVTDEAHHLAGKIERGITAVSHAKHKQCVGKTGDAEARSAACCARSRLGAAKESAKHRSHCPEV